MFMERACFNRGRCMFFLITTLFHYSVSPPPYLRLKDNNPCSVKEFQFLRSLTMEVGAIASAFPELYSESSSHICYR